MEWLLVLRISTVSSGYCAQLLTIVARQQAALEALLEVAGESPEGFAAVYASRMPWLRGFLSHTDAAGALWVYAHKSLQCPPMLVY